MSRGRRLTRLTVCALFGIAAAWATATGFRHARSLWQEPDWPAATAEILDVIAAPPRYRLRVRLLPPGREAVTADTIDLIGEDQLSLLREVGSTAHAGNRPTALVYYRPDRPDEVRLARQNGGARILAVVYGALALASAALSLAAFRRAAALGLSPAESPP
ncbi:hypothetical protein [Zavarzinia compransoris]|uniref:DUF3592 domain-containing protein n=1 Tax=Zavarzinia compransoris TaxID=1264899 RepID=A0A317DWG9_9PROT|nr:hypothetical protein [Zavarzinia compransoris]PWR19039.1 hypothetical protein DKG75_18930 [Zavarzinia compransoris]TDP49046.1 hypothetical protein DES42_101407 [Zavarzinia compransoris]